MERREEARRKALSDLQEYGVLMLDGHFDYGNGFHGRVYLNAHELLKYPSTIWRFAQDLIDVIPPDLVQVTEVVAGPLTGGALLAHTLAGLLDSRRSLVRPAYSFTPFNLDVRGDLILKPFYAQHVAGKHVLLADDVRNTGLTFKRCARLIEGAGGLVVATAEIFDRMEASEILPAPNFALAEYRAPQNYPVTTCPMCHEGVPIARF